MDPDSDRGVSRRKVLAGAILFVGGTSRIVDDRTAARFSDSKEANGTVRVEVDPNLDYLIDDESKNTNAEYEIYFQVEWVNDFDKIEIEVENLDKDYLSAQTFTRYVTEGSVSYPEGGGSDGNALGDTYRFTFRVYRTGQTSPVIERTIEDKADGNNQSEGEFGDPNGPTVERITVTDTTENDNTYYTVEYEASNTNFSEAWVTFDNRANDWSDKTKTSTVKPTGSVSYYDGGTEGDTYDITVELKSVSGLTVASQTVTDIADGTDSDWTD